MKRLKVFILFILASFICLNAQNMLSAGVESVDIDVMNIEHSTEMVFNSDISTDKKFLNAKVWAAKTFGDYKKVVQFEDESAGKIIFKGISKLPVEENKKLMPSFTTIITPVMSYTITIDIRPDKYRVKIEDIDIYSKWESNMFGKVIDSDVHQSVKQFCATNDDFDYTNRRITVSSILHKLYNSLYEEINTVDDF